MQHVHEACNLACGQVVERVNDALGCGVVDLDSGRFVSIQHFFPDMVMPTIDALGQTILELFRGKRIRRMQKAIAQELGQKSIDIPTEMFFSTPGACFFMKAVREARCAILLISETMTNQSTVWLALRAAARDIKESAIRGVGTEQPERASPQSVSGQIDEIFDELAGGEPEQTQRVAAFQYEQSTSPEQRMLRLIESSKFSELAQTRRLQSYDPSGPSTPIPTRSPGSSADVASIGSRLRALRKTAGYTVRETSNRIGCQPIDWERWERGQRPIPQGVRATIVRVFPEAADFL